MSVRLFRRIVVIVSIASSIIVPHIAIGVSSPVFTEGVLVGVVGVVGFVSVSVVFSVSFFLSFMTTFWISAVSSTLNLIVSATSYPSGAVISVSV